MKVEETISNISEFDAIVINTTTRQHANNNNNQKHSHSPVERSSSLAGTNRLERDTTNDNPPDDDDDDILDLIFYKKQQQQVNNAHPNYRAITVFRDEHTAPHDDDENETNCDLSESLPAKAEDGGGSAPVCDDDDSFCKVNGNDHYSWTKPHNNDKKEKEEDDNCWLSDGVPSKDKMFVAGSKHDAPLFDEECHKYHQGSKQEHIVINSNNNHSDVMESQTGDGIFRTDQQVAAIATLVSDSNQVEISTAIQYDPKSKSVPHRNHRFVLCVLVVFILVAAITVFLVIRFRPAKQEQQQQSFPTRSPTHTKESSSGILAKLLAVIGEERFYNENASFSQAANWIINQDTLLLEPDSPNLVQRWLLASFYFSTTSTGTGMRSNSKPWRTCNPPKNNRGDDCNLLIPFRFVPLLQVSKLPAKRWLSGLHECHWAGVQCDPARVVRGIQLPFQNIRSTIPSELSFLPFLNAINLNWNSFYGSLPPELVSHPTLASLEIQYNFLTGSIPNEITSSTSLARLNVEGNLLTGTIPSHIGNVTTLKGLFLAINRIGGTIPGKELGQLTRLSHLRLSHTRVSGPIPSELGLLPALEELWLYRSQVSGTIPAELGRLTRLFNLRIHSTKIAGTIPPELFYGLVNLHRLDIYDNALSGTVSSFVGRMKNLRFFRIHENRLGGRLPSELFSLSRLQVVKVQGNNKLTGSIPADICNGMTASASAIRSIMANCLPQYDTNDGQVMPPLIDCQSDCCICCELNAIDCKDGTDQDDEDMSL